MRTEGTLTKWNDDRGFGFIAPTQSGPEVFVHVSAFPKDGRRPTVGERLTFEIETDSAGKKRAKNVLCPGRPAVLPARQSMSRRRSEKPGLFGRVIPLVVVAALGLYGYTEYSRRVAPQTAVAAQSSDQAASSAFYCDVTLPWFDVHQKADNFRMNGEGNGQESVGAKPAVHG